MKRIYILFSFFLFSLFSFSSLQSYAQNFNVGIKEGVGKQVVVYFEATGMDLNYIYKDFQVTVKWPVNTVSITNLNANYGILNDPQQTDGVYNYLVFKTANVGQVNFAANGTQYPAFSLDYSFSGTACSGQFEIENSTWAGANNGLLTLIGFDNNPWPYLAISNTAAANLNPVKLLNVTKQDVLCKDETSGSITIVASSQTSALEYSINNGLNYQASNTFSGLGASTSNIPVARNAQGCKVTGSAISILEPSSSVIITSQVATDITCNNLNNGKIVIAAGGGTGSLQYSINAGLAYSTDPNFLNLPASNYSIRVKDANNCVAIGAVRTINNPLAINIQSTEKHDITCFGANNGYITVVATGGSGVLTFSVNDGVSYINNGGNFTNLLPSTYGVKVKDVNNCVTSVGNFTVVEPSQINISNVAMTPVSYCSALDGEIAITASGGTGTLVYSLGGSTYQSGNTFSNLTRANYYTYVKDANACTAYKQVALGEANPIIIDSLSVTSLQCYGDLDGEIVVHARGGFTPLTYSLDNSNYSSNSMFSNLQGANYAAFVKDSKGCYVYKQTQVLQPNPIQLSVADVKNITTCYGDPIGMLRFSAVGGTGTLLYSINEVDFQSSSQFKNIVGGNYIATAKDVRGCFTSITAIIDQPQQLVSNMSITDITCFDRSNGAVKIAPSGGTPSYSISWSYTDGDSDNYNLLNLSPNTYTVTIIDSKGCKIIDTAEITAPVEINISADVENLSCFAAKDGKITLHVGGGQAPYRYRWTPSNQMTAIIENMEAGSYRVEVTDFRQCKKFYTAEITQPVPLSLTSEIKNTSYFGATDGSIELIVSGGTKPYNYEWNTGAITATVNNLPTGDYWVKVFDANYCEIDEDFKISTDLTDVEIPTAFTPNGDGKNDVWVLKSIIKYPDAELKIFDSRGYLVYNKKGDLDEYWDGKDNSGSPLPGSSLYYYVIDVNKNTAPFKGTVYIIR